MREKKLARSKNSNVTPSQFENEKQQILPEETPEKTEMPIPGKLENHNPYASAGATELICSYDVTSVF
jgi:hypothetical protein